MCNQCADVRRLHTKTVYGVFHNSKMILVVSTEDQAFRSVEIMRGNWCNCEPDQCSYEVFEIERKSIEWEGYK